MIVDSNHSCLLYKSFNALQEAPLARAAGVSFIKEFCHPLPIKFKLFLNTSLDVVCLLEVEYFTKFQNASSSSWECQLVLKNSYWL
jgi:hypothetical protein